MVVQAVCIEMRRNDGRMNVRYWISDTRVIALIESIKEQYCKEETL